MGQELSFTLQGEVHGQSKMDLQIKELVADAAYQILQKVFLYVFQGIRFFLPQMCATQVMQVLVYHLELIQTHLLMRSAKFNAIEST